MAKFPTYPVILDNCAALSIADLKKFGLLSEGVIKRHSVSITGRNERTDVLITANLDKLQVVFTYQANGKTWHNSFNLFSQRSNIGNGLIYYFFCNRSYQRCRKLYFVGGLFLSRHALRNVAYYEQTLSSFTRNLKHCGWGYEREVDKLLKELKTVRKRYAGKPTKRFLYIVQRLESLHKREQLGWANFAAKYPL